VSVTIDIHVHTSETSGCGRMPGAELARVYADAGYDAVLVCDHYYDGWFETRADLSWPEQVRQFCRGYRAVSETGATLGLDVFFGVELRLNGCSNDYLVIGVDEAFLVSHPRLYELSLFDAYALLDSNGALLVQAHPFRPLMTPVNPALLHGVEVVNGHPNHASDNARALAYARECAFAVVTGGSDAHFREGACTAGMRFARPLRDSRDLARALRAGEATEIFGPDGFRLPLGAGDAVPARR